MNCELTNETMYDNFWFLTKLISFSAYFWIRLNMTNESNQVDVIRCWVTEIWFLSICFWNVSSKFKPFAVSLIFDFRLHPIFPHLIFCFRFGWTGLSPGNINILDSWTRFWVQFIFRQRCKKKNDHTVYDVLN